MWDDPMLRKAAEKLLEAAREIERLGGGSIRFVPDDEEYRHKMKHFDEKRARKKDGEL